MLQNTKPKLVSPHIFKEQNKYHLLQNVFQDCRPLPACLGFCLRTHLRNSVPYPFHSSPGRIRQRRPRCQESRLRKVGPCCPPVRTELQPFRDLPRKLPRCVWSLPGEPRYKDPTRGDVSFAIMMVERADLEAIAAAPKPGSEPGCAGCKN